MWCTHFCMRTRYCQKVVLKIKMSLGLKSFICYIQYRVVKICFNSCRYQNQNFSLVSHSCRSFSTLVALVSFLQHSCRTHFVRVALVSLVFGTCFVKQARSIFNIKFEFSSKSRPLFNVMFYFCMFSKVCFSHIQSAHISKCER